MELYLIQKKTNMEKKIKLAIEEYQCSGCVFGGDVSCFEKSQIDGVGCGKHRAGTHGLMTGPFFLGMPKGFNRIGEFSDMVPIIYDTFEKHYDTFNVPVWKHLSKEGHTFVRGFRPRRNEPFLQIFLENCIDKIDCLEINSSDIDQMD